MGQSISLMHLLFLDDVLIFYSCIILEGNWFNGIIKTCCSANGMSINLEKPSIYISYFVGGNNRQTMEIFGFQTHSLDGGFKYLG